jgi:hypothetical protein
MALSPLSSTTSGRRCSYEFYNIISKQAAGVSLLDAGPNTETYIKIHDVAVHELLIVLVD